MVAAPQLLERLPATARLRLDANAGWDRAEADRWVEVLAADPRLEWLEQPLAVDDLDGLNRLAERLPWPWMSPAGAPCLA